MLHSLLAALFFAQAHPVTFPASLPLPPDVAEIIDTGSTNLGGYYVLLTRDGHVDVTTTAPGSANATPAPPVATHIEPLTAAALFADLERAKPLDGMTVATCVKSASFGTSLFVAYGDRQSPDLSCGGGLTATRLQRDITAITREIGIGRHPILRHLL